MAARGAERAEALVMSPASAMATPIGQHPLHHHQPTRRQQEQNSRTELWARELSEVAFAGCWQPEDTWQNVWSWMNTNPVSRLLNSLNSSPHFTQISSSVYLFNYKNDYILDSKSFELLKIVRFPPLAKLWPSIAKTLVLHEIHPFFDQESSKNLPFSIGNYSRTSWSQIPVHFSDSTAPISPFKIPNSNGQVSRPLLASAFSRLEERCLCSFSASVTMPYTFLLFIFPFMYTPLNAHHLFYLISWYNVV